MPSVLPGCNTNCHAASGEACKCACGGRYHGIVRPGELLPQNETEAEHILTEGFLPGKQYELFDQLKQFGKFRQWINKLLHYTGIKAKL